MSKKLITNDTVIWWGRYKGFPVDIIVCEEPEYIVILNHSKFFSIAADILYEAQQKLPNNHYLLKDQTWQPLELDWKEKLSFQEKQYQNDNRFQRVLPIRQEQKDRFSRQGSKGFKSSYAKAR